MINFIDEEKRLSVAETKYWRKVFNANLMIGTEIEQMFRGNSLNTSDVRELLSPLGIGGDPTRFKSPVSTVKSDGSLRGGGEIITPGRKVYGFMEQFSMYQAIYNCLRNSDPIIHQRCGWHNHIVLQDYGAMALEREYIPRVIFDNLMLIIKHYYPSLVFMTSTLPYGDCITRYDSFNRTRGLEKYRTDKTLYQIKSDFSDRYNAVNINPLDVNTDKDVLKGFHIEFRFPDGTLFPIQMASLNILFKALVIKAIELSKYGIINFDSDTNSLYCIKNDGEDDSCINSFEDDERKSAMVSDEMLEEIKNLSKEFVSFLEPEIISIDKLALTFLKELSVKPISLMFRELGTQDLRIVNDKLEEMLDTVFKKHDSQVMPLMEIIDLGLIRNTETVEKWVNEASALVSYKEPIRNIINEINSISELGFSKELGFYFK